jgi:hypothetical protein
MSRNRIHACALVVSLAAVGCQQNVRPAAVVAQPAVTSPRFTTVTLSAEQLMSLDRTGRAAGHAAIVAKRPVGAGVEFDIRFPGSDSGVCSLDYTSSGVAGKGTLAGIDVSAYQTLALKFTLVSANGQSDPNLPLELAAGAIIGPAGDGKLSSCEPVTLGFAPEQATKVAKTPMHAGKIRVIGIHTHVANPQVWDVNGGVVTLRVEPAADAEVLPSPAPAPGRKSGNGAAKPVRPKAQSESAKPAAPKSETSDASRPVQKPRTRSSSSPSLGTTHVGAW